MQGNLPFFKRRRAKLSSVNKDRQPGYGFVALSLGEVLATLPVDPYQDRDYLSRQFRDAMVRRDSERTEVLLLLAGVLQLDADCIDVYCVMMTSDHHEKHEDLAHVLQSLHDPRAIESLYFGALSRFPYREYDDYGMLADQCMYALRSIGTLEAMRAVARLSEADDPVIAELAEWHLEQGPLASRATTQATRK